MTGADEAMEEDATAGGSDTTELGAMTRLEEDTATIGEDIAG